MAEKKKVELKEHYKGFPTYDPDSDQFLVQTEHWDDKDIDVIYRKGIGTYTAEEMKEKREAGEFLAPFCYTAKLNTHTYEAAPGILCDRDTPVKMRDGVTIYADIYRPKDSGPVPCIVSWGPFGKNMFEGTSAFKPMGVPPQTISPFAKFESADPGYWCHYGYAVANVDPRGVGNSEGLVSNWGVQDHKDGYDFIEWCAEQDWCTGKVSMFGNSGVCMVIWGIAAEQPPHLACIAGWEGTGDMYRESLTLGGIPAPGYNDNMLNTVASSTYIEDCPNMLNAHPLYDEYWEVRAPKWEKIKAPAYLCAGMCHIHCRGSFEAFRHIRSPKKWMRAHREMEWPDTYDKDNLEELRMFFDRYLKDIHNGWEFTPKIRIDVMDAYDFDFQPKRPEREFPLARTEYKKIYLDAATHSGSLRALPGRKRGYLRSGHRDHLL
jgi:predicted acyl esterase